MQKVIFATNNSHKLLEIREMLGDHFTLMSLNEIGFSGDIPETKPTLEANALDKARYIFERYGLPCFADDTGLEIEALQGEPGVYSARYSGGITDFGSEKKRSEANVDKVLGKMTSKPNRKARFRTAIAYLDGKKEYVFEGIVNGYITDKRKGNDGFGYDPIFVPEGYEQTFAEMPLSEKNKISHRARAFNKFIAFLKGQVIPD
jgi:XTP/dITP diphosphohydrolase